MEVLITVIIAKHRKKHGLCLQKKLILLPITKKQFPRIICNAQIEIAILGDNSKQFCIIFSNLACFNAILFNVKLL